jgi:glutathione synthase/RimK-type ligase-like ATP-grasp enzyme
MARILVTSSRMPFALDEIRKFGRCGHEIHASDTYAAAPGSHSKHVREVHVTPPPRFEPTRFIAALREIVTSRGIDVLVPAFEEAFYVAAAADELAPHTEIFAPSFDTLALLHDKARFVAWACEIGLPVPRSRTVTDREGLRDAIAELPQFFARPVFSRGGLSLFTNTGPLQGALRLEQCDPTTASPWIVQEFVHGEDVCSFSVVHHGQVAAHSTYVHPRMLDHAGGITFESVEIPETLAAARQIAEATRYHGQLSLDFMRSDGGFVLIECNPRPTGGVYVMPDQMFVDAVLQPDLRRTTVAPAGARAKVGAALVRDMLLHLTELPADLKAIITGGRDVYADPHDFTPALYGLLSGGLVRKFRREMHLDRAQRSDLAASMFYDISWDGPSAPEPWLDPPSARR